MRQPRMKIDCSSGTAVYHCISRTVAGERLLGDVEREVLRKTLWRVAGFCGVEVLSYCILSNHFHVLVRVPEARAEDLDRAELLRRYRILYGEGHCGFFPDPAVMEALFRDPDSEDAARWERRLRTRMNDVSQFMKTLKQRFTTWFNKTHGRFGTLWAERFKSVFVQNDPGVLRIVAAYIDLNPVRAGMVDDPGAYRWSSYGEAMAGRGPARQGLAGACGYRRWRDAAPHYRMVLFGKGANGRIGEQGVISPERVREVLEQGGEISAAELLRSRLRFLTDGAVLGSKGFVLEMEAKLASRGIAPVKRRRIAQLPSIEDVEIHALRGRRDASVT